jgi:hypothetical protein
MEVYDLELVELYGDAGLLKNRNQSGKFVYDSGIRLNLVPEL